MQGAPGGEFFVGEGNAETVAVVFHNLGLGVAGGSPIAKAGYVHAPNVVAGVAGGHPVGHGEADAAALAETSHDAGCDPVASLPSYRPDNWVAIGGKSKGAVNDLFDSYIVENREVVEANFKRGGESFNVGGEEL